MTSDFKITLHPAITSSYYQHMIVFLKNSVLTTGYE